MPTKRSVLQLKGFLQSVFGGLVMIYTILMATTLDDISTRDDYYAWLVIVVVGIVAGACLMIRGIINFCNKLPRYEFTTETCPNKGEIPKWGGLWVSETFVIRQGPSPEGDGPAVSHCELCGYGDVDNNWEGSPFKPVNLPPHP